MHHLVEYGGGVPLTMDATRQSDTQFFFYAPWINDYVHKAEVGYVMA
jgi:hypothetical protein